MKTYGKIIGVGSYLPEKVITNDDISKIVDTSDEWIKSRTGICERRLADEKTSTSMLALNAAKAAISDAKIDPKKIDLIIVATCTPDMQFPSTACILQSKLGLNNIPCFDISAACSGFNYAITVANSFIISKQAKTILVVGADTLAKYLDWTDRGTCILFGDGAGAVVMEAANDGSGVLASVLGAEGSGGHLLTFRGGGSIGPMNRVLIDEKEYCIKMKGSEVFKFAVRVLEDGTRLVLKKAKLKIPDINLLIPHQANIRIIDHAIKKLGLSKENVYVNLQKYGNTSAASIPIAIFEAKQEGRIKSGDIVVIVGFGAGLTYGANLIKF